MKLLTYPVICFGRDEMKACADKPRFETCSLAAYHAGYYNRMEVVDSDGMGKAVERAILWPATGPISWLGRLISKRARVEILLGVLEKPYSVLELKERILARLDSEPGWRSQAGYQAVRAKVEQAGTCAACIAAVLEARGGK